MSENESRPLGEMTEPVLELLRDIRDSLNTLRVFLTRPKEYERQDFFLPYAPPPHHDAYPHLNEAAFARIRQLEKEGWEVSFWEGETDDLSGEFIAGAYLDVHAKRLLPPKKGAQLPQRPSGPDERKIWMCLAIANDLHLPVSRIYAFQKRTEEPLPMRWMKDDDRPDGFWGIADEDYQVWKAGYLEATVRQVNTAKRRTFDKR